MVDQRVVTGHTQSVKRPEWSAGSESQDPFKKNTTLYIEPIVFLSDFDFLSTAQAKIIFVPRMKQTKYNQWFSCCFALVLNFVHASLHDFEFCACFPS